MICLDAFKNLNIATKGDLLFVSPCCITPLQQADKIDFHNDRYLSRIRKSWEDQIWPAECHTCRRAESRYGISRRLGSNDWYQANGIDDSKIDLIRIDYWVGDTCNLACVMCGPENSSAWKQELGMSGPSQRASFNKFWPKLDLQNLRYIHFHGGEPLLSKEHVIFLESIPDKSSVHVFYNTNATVMPDAHLRSVWEQFKLVQIDFSIDDIGDRFGYIRYPAKWDRVVDNLFWCREFLPHNCIFDILTVISVLNEPYLDQLKDWAKKNFCANRFGDEIQHRFQDCNGTLACERKTQRRQDIIDYLDEIDARRGLDWRKTFPLVLDSLRI